MVLSEAPIERSPHASEGGTIAGTVGDRREQTRKKTFWTKNRRSVEDLAVDQSRQVTP